MKNPVILSGFFFIQKIILYLCGSIRGCPFGKFQSNDTAEIIPFEPAQVMLRRDRT